MEFDETKTELMSFCILKCIFLLVNFPCIKFLEKEMIFAGS